MGGGRPLAPEGSDDKAGTPDRAAPRPVIEPADPKRLARPTPAARAPAEIDSDVDAAHARCGARGRYFAPGHTHTSKYSQERALPVLRIQAGDIRRSRNESRVAISAVHKRGGKSTQQEREAGIEQQGVGEGEGRVDEGGYEGSKIESVRLRVAVDNEPARWRSKRHGDICHHHLASSSSAVCACSGSQVASPILLRRHLPPQSSPPPPLSSPRPVLTAQPAFAYIQ